ncbi:VENN motif pre-toxin domain-containing protein [Actinobacillus equuli]|uniref:VENN motif pre-toxin domain-containing protein n=1 Tax=Actinobacillus equuli TaxID=718 RepID=UPI0024466015|nr:VENN motif pre-toxin domain-containing protein [Actinobacillus equuli]WGE82660.1 VENN motif pre-toxin domain-containing protein [Actinobacillus equuli subsp. equuli]
MQFTGNNAVAGAVGALTAEVAAPEIMKVLYNTDNPESLSDSQKQNVANLSQIAAGLAGGLTGDSTASGVAGAEIGKRAVENNLLSKADDDLVYILSEKYRKNGSLTREEIEKLRGLLIIDKYTDSLLQQYQTSPNNLSDKQKAFITQEVGRIANSYGISPDILFNMDLNNVMRRNDTDIKNYIRFNDSWNTKIVESTAEGLSYAGGVPIGGTLHSIPKVGNILTKYPILSEKVSNAALSMGTTYASNIYSGEDTAFSDLAWSGTTAFITGGMSVPKTIGINTISSGIQASQKGEDPFYAGLSSGVATGAGAMIGKGIATGGYRISVGNVARNKDYYEPQYRTKQAMNFLNEDYKYLPNKLGALGDSSFSEMINNWLNEKGKNNEGK